MSDMHIERTINDGGEIVFTAVVPIPATADPDVFCRLFEAELRYSLRLLLHAAQAPHDSAVPATLTTPDNG